MDDPTDHQGYQGTHIGFPFHHSQFIECIMWVTGESAFMDCINTETNKMGRAGYGRAYGLWKVYTSNTGYCCNLSNCEGPTGPPGNIGPD